MLSHSLLLVVCLVLAACTTIRQTAETIGLTDPSAPPPLTVSIGCDISSVACSPEHLRDLLVWLLPAISARPSSVVRLFVLGDDLASTRLVAETHSMAPPSLAVAVVKSHAAAFVAATQEAFTTAMAGRWSQRRAASPIIEGLGAITTYPANGKKVVLLLTDLRQESPLGSFECNTLPRIASWQQQTKRALAHLTDATVIVAYASPLEPVSGGRCRPSNERYDRIVDLWTGALQARGARLTVFADTIPKPLESFIGGTP